jgi:hypothetical protein
MMEKPTKERLAEALEQAGAPQHMVEKARSGYYDDFESPLAMPIRELVSDAVACGHRDIARRAKHGEFDATEAESDAWLEREGRALLEGGREPRR